MSDFIPDYSKYSLPQLIDVYKRIENEKYPEKVKIIKDEIILKLNLGRDIDFDSYETQRLFDKILAEGYPFKPKKIKNVALGKKIDSVGWIILYISILLFIINEKYKSEYVSSFAMLGTSLFLAANVIQSYYTEIIHIKFISIKKSDSPGNFLSFQIMFSIISIAILFVIVKFVTS